MNVGLVFRSAEIPTGNQYLRKNSPIGVPLPTRVSISFCSLVSMRSLLVGIDDAGCQLGVRGVERRIPRSQQLQLAQRLLQEIEAVVLRDRILGQVPFAGVDADLALVRAHVQHRTPVVVVLFPRDLGQLVADVDLVAEDAVDGLFPVEPRELGAPEGRPDHRQHQLWFLLNDVDRRREASFRQRVQVARRSQAVPAHADGNVPVRWVAADRVQLTLLEEGEAIALRVRWLAAAIDPGYVVWVYA